MGDELFPAALVSLGLLGVVTKVSSDQNVTITISYGFLQTMSVSSPNKRDMFYFEFKIVCVILFIF
jgi:hypothetical protein